MSSVSLLPLYPLKKRGGSLEVDRASTVARALLAFRAKDEAVSPDGPKLELELRQRSGRRRDGCGSWRKRRRDYGGSWGPG